MQKFAEKIVKFRYIILALGILLLIPSAIGFMPKYFIYEKLTIPLHLITIGKDESASM